MQLKDNFEAMAYRAHVTDNLLSIPAEVTKPILVEWLSLEDVVKLDNAYTSRTFRQHLLTVMSQATGTSTIYRHCKFSFPNDWDGPYTRSVHYFAWLVSRRILVSEADIQFALVALKTVSAEFLALQVPFLEVATFTGTEYAPSTTLRFLTAMAESCRALQDISLCGGFEIDAAFITHLSTNCPKLRRIAFTGYSIYTDIDAISCGNLRFPALLTLDIDNATVTDGTMHVLLQGSPQLAHLRLCDTYQLSELTFANIALYTHSLQSLELENIEVSDALLIPVVRANPGLTKFVLEVADAAEITDALVLEIARRCTHLTHFDVNNAWELTDQALYAIADHCPNLSVLNLRNNAHYTNAAIQHLAARCTQLRSVQLFDCTEVTKQEAKGYFSEQVDVAYHLGLIPFWM